MAGHCTDACSTAGMGLCDLLNCSLLPHCSSLHAADCTSFNRNKIASATFPPMASGQYC